VLLTAGTYSIAALRGSNTELKRKPSKRAFKLVMAKKKTAMQGKKNKGTTLVTTVSRLARIQTNRKTTAIAPAFTMIKTIPAKPRSTANRKKPRIAESVVTKTIETKGVPE
jgi:hypothetical protein